MAEMAERGTKVLPIRRYRDQIVECLRENSIVVIVGHTGCGKSTQLPQMLYEEGYGDRGVIACTQPRRFAAYSLAKRVAEERSCMLGDVVGYRIRFDNRTNHRTRILYMTDGSLLMDRLLSLSLSKYSAVMLDEVHERALQTDLLFGLLKQTVNERRDLRVIITSATMEADAFARYFNAPVIEVQGSMFNVDVIYRPIAENNNGQVASIIKQLDQEEAEGDVLVFLAGKPEIEDIAKILSKEKRLHVLPAHAELPTDEMDRIHEDAPEGRRKVVLATNVAETSLTVEGIVFVVDQGYVKINIYNSETDTSELKRIRCSQAEAQQRKGRAGRTRPGACYRLYSETVFEEEMAKLRPPEVTRTNLTAMVLQLKLLGYTDVLLFDFLSPPNLKNLRSALNELHRLEALDADCLLTRKGRLMASCPLEPKLARCLVQSSEEGCAKEMLMICAMISAFNDANIRKLSPILTNNSDKVKELVSDEGETFALLKVFKKCLSRKSKPQTMEKFELSWTVMKEAEQIHSQLRTVMTRLKLPVQSCGAQTEPVIRSLVSGLFHYLIVYEEPATYRLLRDMATTNVSTYLLSENAKRSTILVGTHLSKPSERKDRTAVCVTAVPSSVDTSEYIQRLQCSCQHFERTAGLRTDPSWLSEAEQWHEKFVNSQSENASLKTALEAHMTESGSLRSRCRGLEKEKVRLETTVSTYRSQSVTQTLQCETLKSENRRLERTVREQKNEIEASKRKALQHERERADAASDLATLRRQHDTLKTEKNRLEASANLSPVIDVSAWESEIRHLRREKTDAENRIADLENEVRRLRLLEISARNSSMRIRELKDQVQQLEREQLRDSQLTRQPAVQYSATLTRISTSNSPSGMLPNQRVRHRKDEDKCAVM